MYKQSIKKIIQGLDKVFGFVKIKVLTPPASSLDHAGFLLTKDELEKFLDKSVDV